MFMRMWLILMILMFMVVRSVGARWVSVSWFFIRAGRHRRGIGRLATVCVTEGVRVFMFMLVGVTVYLVSMSVRVLVQVVMQVLVLMFMLQTHNLQTTAVTIGKIELVEAGQIAVVKEFLCSVILNQATFVQNQCAASQLANKEEVVADQDQGNVQSFENPQQQLLSCWVKTGRWLVKNQDLRLHGQYGCQCQALALSTREIQGNTLVETNQPDPFKDLCNPFFNFPSGQPQLARTKGNFLIT